MSSFQSLSCICILAFSITQIAFSAEAPPKAPCYIRMPQFPVLAASNYEECESSLGTTARQERMTLHFDNPSGPGRQEGTESERISNLAILARHSKQVQGVFQGQYDVKRGLEESDLYEESYTSQSTIFSFQYVNNGLAPLAIGARIYRESLKIVRSDGIQSSAGGRSYELSALFHKSNWNIGAGYEVGSRVYLEHLRKFTATGAMALGSYLELVPALSQLSVQSDNGVSVSAVRKSLGATCRFASTRVGIDVFQQNQGSVDQLGYTLGTYSRYYPFFAEAGFEMRAEYILGSVLLGAELRKSTVSLRRDDANSTGQRTEFNGGLTYIFDNNSAKHQGLAAKE